MKHAYKKHSVQDIRISAPANMNVTEAAIYCDVSERSIRERIATRELRHIRFGRRIILRKVDLDSFLESMVRG